MLESIVLQSPTEFFRPFPDSSTILSDRAKSIAKWVLPVATVNLDALNCRMSGKVHFVIAVDHWIGEHGARTTQSHTRFCTNQWIAFNVDDESRYSLAAPDDYFFDAEGHPYENLTKHTAFYAEALKTYAEAKGRFQKNGVVTDEQNRVVDHAYLGGHCGWPNFAEENPLPHRIEKYVDSDSKHLDWDFVPVADDGSAFTFIGWFHAFSYAPSVPYSVFLFYHPELRLAIQTIDI